MDNTTIDHKALTQNVKNIMLHARQIKQLEDRTTAVQRLNDLFIVKGERGQHGSKG